MALSVCLATLDGNTLEICENLDPLIVEQNRRGFFSRYSGVCTLPDFFPEIADILRQTNPSIFVLGTIREARSKTYLHNEFLPNNMSQLGYSRVSMEEDFDKDKLSISVYARSSIIGLTSGTIQTFAKVGKIRATHREDNRCLVSYLSIYGYGNIAFLLFSSSDDSDSIFRARNEGDPMIRQNVVLDKCTFVNSSIQVLAKQLSSKGVNIDFVFAFGDMGYRTKMQRGNSYLDLPGLVTILEGREGANIIPSLYQDYDELYSSLTSNLLYPLQEGINGKGPEFPPTCSFRKNRDVNCSVGCYDIGVYNSMPPSWCNRCLYLNLSARKISCVQYNRITSGKLQASGSKLGVYALYSLSN